MNTFHKILLASIVWCCACALNAEDKSQQNATIELEKYTNHDKGYSLDYPADWKKSDVPQLDLVLFAPTKGKDENPHASMNIVSEKVGKGINLEQFYSESAANLSGALKEVSVEKSGLTLLNGTPSKWMLYTHTMQGIKFRVLQYFIVAQETIFLITFSASAEDFDRYQSDFKAIANSFKIAPSLTHIEIAKPSTATPAASSSPNLIENPSMTAPSK
jgi:hypothetical protein